MKQGDSWIDSDGCNKCLCGALGAVCTEKACGQHHQFDDGDAHIDEVVYNQQASKTEAVGNQQCRDHRNQPRQPGETWLTEDSCNVCSCKGKRRGVVYFCLCGNIIVYTIQCGDSLGFPTDR